MMYRYLVIAFLLAQFFSDANGQSVPNKEDWTEMPQVISVEADHNVPSDARILFDGVTLDKWQHADGGEVQWKIENDVLRIVPGTGDIFTKVGFGDCQLHVEWMIPENNYGSGNSGIYLMGRYEVQIFNSYQNDTKIYYNGQTGSLYKQHKPLVNASRPRGQWESFDIIFNAPQFDSSGKLLKPAKFTVLQNGVLIQKEATLKGITTHEKLTGYEYHRSKEPLMIQDHGDPVRFRNIWIREL